MHYSFEHQRLQVFVENGVFDSVEHNLDVLSVHCCGEVMEQWTDVVSLCITKQFEQEHLSTNLIINPEFFSSSCCCSLQTLIEGANKLPDNQTKISFNKKQFFENEINTLLISGK